MNLSLPDVDAEVSAAVNRYVPALLDEAQRSSGLASMRHLVLACGPVACQDAGSMLSTLSRFVADVSQPAVIDLDRLVVDGLVSAWLHRLAADGVPEGTVSNHRQRMARLLRVRRGLPARIAVRDVPRRPCAPLDPSMRRHLERELLTADAPVVAAYVAGVGAGVIASKAVGAVVVVGADGAWMDLDGRRFAIVSELVSLSTLVAGRVVDGSGWQRLRDHAARVGVSLDARAARATFTDLAVREARTAVELIERYGLTQRAIDDAIPHLPEVSSDAIRASLRG